MAHNTDAIWRLPLPENWEPEGTWCVTIPIPADQEYMDRLTAALGLLTIQKTWARDDTRTGAKTVAYTWEQALYSVPFQVDMRACHVEPYPASNPTEAATAAATTITNFVIAIVTSAVTAVDLGTSCEDWTAAMIAQLQPFGSTDGIVDALGRVCDAVSDKSEPDREPYTTECAYVDMFASMKDYIAAKGPDYTQQFSDWWIGFAFSTEDSIEQAISQVAALFGPDGLTAYAKDFGPDVDGAHYGDDCTWSQLFDFRVTADHWDALEIISGEPGAIYAGGDGWISRFITSLGANFLYIVCDVPRLTHVTVNYDMTDAPGFSGIDVRVYSGAGRTGSVLSTSDDNTYPDVSFSDRTFECDVAGGGLSVLVDQNGMTDAAIHSIILYGTGINPFM